MKNFWVCSAMFLKTSLPFPQQCSKENTCPCFPWLLNSHSSQPPFPEFSPQAAHSPHSSSDLLLSPPKLSGSHPLDTRLSLEVRASGLVLSCPYFLHGDIFHFVLLEGPFSSAHLDFLSEGKRVLWMVRWVRPDFRGPHWQEGRMVSLKRQLRPSPGSFAHKSSYGLPPGRASSLHVFLQNSKHMWQVIPFVAIASLWSTCSFSSGLEVS